MSKAQQFLVPTMSGAAGGAAPVVPLLFEVVATWFLLLPVQVDDDE